MRVIIENTNKTRQGTRTEIRRVAYTVNSREECRHKHDQYVYDLVVEHGDGVVCGSTSGWPDPNTDSRNLNLSEVK